MPQRLYADLADWWHLVSPVADYADEAQLYAELLRDGRDLGAAGARLTALELGCGGGHCAFHMRDSFAWTLTDASPAMLAQSRRRNPEVPHEPGDMRSLRLGRQFDAVFAHDAIMYMTTIADLEAACRTAFAHCRPGGVVLLAPDWTAETFAPGVDHGGADGDGRALRFLEWVHAPVDGVVAVDFAFLLHDGSASRVVHDRHQWGLFARATWLEVLGRAGFAATAVDVAGEDGRRCLFVGRRATA